MSKMKRWVASLAALVLAGVGAASLPASAQDAPGSSPDNPIIVTDLSEVPEGAVTDGPVYDDLTCSTSQTWVLTVPGEEHEAVTHEETRWSKPVYSWSLDQERSATKTYQPGEDAIYTHSWQKYVRTATPKFKWQVGKVYAEDVTHKEYRWPRETKVEKTKTRLQYQKEVRGDVWQRDNGTYEWWHKTGQKFGWTWWTPASTKWSFNDVEVLEFGPHNGVVKEWTGGNGNKHWRWVSTEYRYVKNGVTEQVPDGHEWVPDGHSSGSTNPSKPSAPAGKRYVDPRGEQTVTDHKAGDPYAPLYGPYTVYADPHTVPFDVGSGLHVIGDVFTYPGVTGSFTYALVSGPTQYDTEYSGWVPEGEPVDGDEAPGPDEAAAEANDGLVYYEDLGKISLVTPAEPGEWTDWAPTFEDDGLGPWTGDAPTTPEPVLGSGYPEGVSPEDPTLTWTQTRTLTQDSVESPGEGWVQGEESSRIYYVEGGEPTVDLTEANWTLYPADEGPEGWEFYDQRTVTDEAAYTDPDVVTYYAWSDGKVCETPTDPPTDPPTDEPTDEPTPTDPPKDDPKDDPKKDDPKKDDSEDELAETGVNLMLVPLIAILAVATGAGLVGIRRRITQG